MRPRAQMCFCRLGVPRRRSVTGVLADSAACVVELALGTVALVAIHRQLAVRVDVVATHLWRKVIGADLQSRLPEGLRPAHRSIWPNAAARAPRPTIAKAMPTGNRLSSQTPDRTEAACPPGKPACCDLIYPPSRTCLLVFAWRLFFVDLAKPSEARAPRSAAVWIAWEMSQCKT